MSLLAWPALILLIAAVVLIALATLSRGPKRTEIGTLLIWRRVAAQRAPQKQRRRNLDPLLWLLLAAVVLGATAAARPAWLSPEAAPRVAVFIERLEPTGTEPLLEEAMQRARDAAPGAELTWFMAGATEDGVTGLNPGTPQSELAQFVARTDEFDGRLMMLHAPGEAYAWGRVLPRATDPQRDVIFELGSRGETISFRTVTVTAPQATGAVLRHSSSTDGETAWTYLATGNDAAFKLGAREVRLARRPFVVGVGANWSSDAHRALFEALGTDSADQAEPRVWLGGERTPGVRINAGTPADLAGATLSFDPMHPLFHDLPLETFDWLASGRVLAPDAGTRPLLGATRDGKTVGDLVRLRGDVLEFAGDPFSFAPVAMAALLLDNAIGVVTGVRPSERPGYRLVSPELPSRRAALSAPFAAVGDLDLSSRREAPIEFTSWLLLAAAALLVAAAYAASRVSGSGPRRP